METMAAKFQSPASRVSGRIIPLLLLAGLRVVIVCLLPIIQR